MGITFPTAGRKAVVKSSSWMDVFIQLNKYMHEAITAVGSIILQQLFQLP